MGLVNIFYCLRFEISLSVASYNSQCYDGSIRPRLHTGVWITSLYSFNTELRKSKKDEAQVHCWSISNFIHEEWREFDSEVRLTAPEIGGARRIVTCVW
jgi:hypothetical protein